MDDRTGKRVRAPKPSLLYPCGDPPASGQIREVAPGVHWIRMPMPLKLTHINLWAIDDGDGVAIVDSGLLTSDTTMAWRTLFTGGLAKRNVSRVFATHMHPDHIGMSGWLTRKFDCRLWMTQLEYLVCRTLVGDTGRVAPEDGVRFYRRAGWDEAAIEHYHGRFGGFGKMIHALPDSYRRVRDGERLMIGQHEWQAVVGTGHSPEHLCLYCTDLKVLISGDQVLPRISTNVSVHPTEPDANPLEDWLTSLAKIRREVPDDVLVLPAHNEPFQGLHARLDHLVRGHERGLERLRVLLRHPKRAVDVFGALFAARIAPTDLDLLGMATGESLAHLNYLVYRGEAVAESADDQVVWYRMV